MREEDLGRYQMLWDCPACGATGLLGVDQKFCATCGSAQDPKTRYFPSDDQKILLEDHPFHGADVVCRACDTPNAAVSEFCTACGSPLDDAAAAATRQSKVVGEGEHFAGETAADAKAEAKAKREAEEARRRARMAGEDPDAPPKKRRGFLGVGLFGGCPALITTSAVACAGFFGLSWLFQTTDQVTIEGHAWKRSIEVEVYGPKQERAWRDKVPAGARIQTCREEKRDTKKVPDGESCEVVKTDKGDGSFSEKKVCKPKYKKVDVMAEKCSYEIDTWTKARVEQAAGADLSPKWPTVKLAQTGTCRGCEREGERRSTFTVFVEDSKGGRHPCELSESRWKGLKPGQKVDATFGGLTGAIDCSSL